MSDFQYTSILCKYCPCTEYGDIVVNSASYNLCEGVSCEQALDTYLDENPDGSEDIIDYF